MKTSVTWLAVGCLVVALGGCKKEGNGDEDMATGDPLDMSAEEFNLDAFLFDNDGMYPDGYVLPPPADGGTIITLPDGGVFVCYITPCQGKVYACGNCMDDDQDGRVDSQDPDCLGPCQNNEAGFFGSIPGQNNAPCKSDCYWDQDTGSGNDECNWSHSCDTFEQGGTVNNVSFDPKTTPEIGCTYDPNTKVAGASVPNGQKDCDYLSKNQAADCKKICAPLTPNGCDCFGCCEDPNRKGNFIYAGSVNAAGTPTCNSDPATMADPSKCKPCTPVLAESGCYNTCETCELCFGKTSLPAECYASQPDLSGVPSDADLSSNPPPPPPQMCPPGIQACGLAGQEPCPPGQFCVTGCCTIVIL
jgi:hypothetical protein